MRNLCITAIFMLSGIATVVSLIFLGLLLHDINMMHDDVISTFEEFKPDAFGIHSSSSYAKAVQTASLPLKTQRALHFYYEII
ncbi:hypothetical protein KIN20_020726 [Parelaphostrongylus tenuis]|uniref:Nematode cuticle collagen N-terminal domain-containing protein n=1 Tax=Parelaphostrongylus tenuis TaxID=148309 RepID=A0AAD5QVQ5_PARTN|nr:hypothetical protein KIN20_020726 [Parelaphostrongylus tenuis]